MPSPLDSTDTSEESIPGLDHSKIKLGGLNSVSSIAQQAMASNITSFTKAMKRTSRTANAALAMAVLAYVVAMAVLVLMLVGCAQPDGRTPGSTKLTPPTSTPKAEHQLSPFEFLLPKHIGAGYDAARFPADSSCAPPKTLLELMIPCDTEGRPR